MNVWTLAYRAVLFWGLSGVYTDIGNASCGDGPGSYGHYEQDAQLLAHDWEIDALKVDFCDFWFIPVQLKMWQDFRDALNSTGGSPLAHP